MYYLQAMPIFIYIHMAVANTRKISTTPTWILNLSCAKGPLQHCRMRIICRKPPFPAPLPDLFLAGRFHCRASQFSRASGRVWLKLPIEPACGVLVSQISKDAHFKKIPAGEIYFLISGRKGPQLMELQWRNSFVALPIVNLPGLGSFTLHV